MSEDDLNDIERHMLDCMNRTQSDARLSGFSDIVREDVPRLIAEVRRLQAIEAAANDAATAIRRVLNLTVKVPAGQLDRLDDCYVFTEHQYRMLETAYTAIVTTKEARG